MHLIITAAFEYLKGHPVDPIDVDEFNETCGVGVVITREEIVQVVMETLDENQKELMEKRYRFNVGKLMGKLYKYRSCDCQVTLLVIL